MAATIHKQLWPTGRSITYRWEPNEALSVQEGDQWRPATDDEKRAVRIEEIAERLQNRDIYCCDSSLVDDCLKLAGEHHGDFFREWEMENVSNLRTDPDNWGLEKCREWLEDNGHDLPDPNPWAMDRAAMIEYLHPDWEGESETTATYDDERIRADVIREANDDDEYTDAWRDAVRDNAEEAEIYEWWRVSKHLAKELDAIGECVLDNAYGTWWGRCTTGQSMMMDGVLQQVAARMLDR